MSAFCLSRSELVEIAVHHPLDVVHLQLRAVVVHHRVRLEHVGADLAAEGDVRLLLVQIGTGRDRRPSPAGRRSPSAPCGGRSPSCTAGTRRSGSGCRRRCPPSACPDRNWSRSPSITRWTSFTFSSVRWSFTIVYGWNT